MGQRNKVNQTVFKIGDKVRHKPTNFTGEIVEIRRDRVLVTSGLLTLHPKIEEIELIK